MPSFDLALHLIHPRERDRQFAGSWDAGAGDADNARSRIEAESLSLMTLQVCYRQLPMCRSLRRQ